MSVAWGRYPTKSSRSALVRTSYFPFSGDCLFYYYYYYFIYTVEGSRVFTYLFDLLLLAVRVGIKYWI